MSLKSIEKFAGFLTENKECREKAESFGSDIKALASYAQEQGFDVTAEELQDLQEKTQQLIKNRIHKIQQSDIQLSEGAREFNKFIELSERDEEVARQIENLSSGSAEELIALGKEKGFIFTEEDMRSVANEIMEPKNELSEEELELVAGGVLLAFASVAAVAAFAGAVGLSVGASAAGLVLFALTAVDVIYES